MKRIINASLLITSLFGYLEWGNRNAFLFEVEYEIFFKTDPSAETFLHLFVMIPIIGQLILLYCIIRPPVKMILTYIGMVCIGQLLLFLFFIGLIFLNPRILLFSLPYVVCMVWAVIYGLKMRKLRLSSSQKT